MHTRRYKRLGSSVVGVLALCWFGCGQDSSKSGNQANESSTSAASGGGAASTQASSTSTQTGGMGSSPFGMQVNTNGGGVPSSNSNGAGGQGSGNASGVAGSNNSAGPTGGTSPMEAGGGVSNMPAQNGGAEAGSGGLGGTPSIDAGTEPEGPRPVVTAAPGTELIAVDAKAPHQTFEGWGTSLCWWANHVGGWEEAARDAVVDAVVDPVEGLGYNIFRYNIGGGENPSHNHMDQFRDMPGFQDADGTWNWEADANQRAMLLSIAERGSEVIFEAFSNSPPYWMTNSGCASGSNDGSNNLKSDSYMAFADYLTEVVKHYRDEYGVIFRTLEPLNEPYANWWKANGSQEGCHFSPSNQEQIITAVAEQLSSKGLADTQVSASDENSMDDALRNLGGFSDATVNVIGQVNVHSYAGSRRAELRDLTTRLGKRLWQSESGPLGESLNSDTDAAVFMARRIITDLRDLKAEAWIDWQAGDPARSWASFTLNDNQQSYAPLKRYFMHAAFSRYIRPGATLIDVDNDNMVAAQNKDGTTFVIVVLNDSANASHSYTFDLTSLPSVGTSVSGYRVSQSEDLEALDPIPIDGYSFQASAPAYSISTFVVPTE